MQKIKTIVLLLVIFLFTACCSGSRRVDKTILDYQRKIDTLEARISMYENTIGDTVRELENIRRRAENIDGTVDELICLFDDYQRAVEQLLYYYRKAEE